MMYGFSIVSTMRTYYIELRERNYPTFNGKYNAYMAVFGQLSGDYLGLIETPIKQDITENDVPKLLLKGEQFVKDHAYCKVSVW